MYEAFVGSVNIDHLSINWDPMRANMAEGNQLGALYLLDER